ncbi:hypothetical protein [Curtobacterium sp. VKM Ac-1376]|uniref:hypothetical protein n=1 Tax=Curtobacterium sp. VKM Ac-1376 TaxID=123312 RepID=UPI00188C9A3F|nr:hypothetical protein [Curtobacterium sp. VKM Ac-1376]MBF4613428.1 hypothetical protein [Curtobacterium sp. VKM Ac-1376]
MPEEVDQPLPTASESVAALDRPTAFFNALLTEHFVLETARSITVSESSSRSSLYLTTLSSSLVAFGFLAHTPFALGFLGAIIPVIVLLGAFTYERLVETSLEDVAALAAMQRIRRYYGRLLPDAHTYFPMPTGRHAANELLDIGRAPSWYRLLFTMSSAIAVVNSIVAGAGVAILVDQLGVDDPGSVVWGVAASVVLAVAHLSYQVRSQTTMHELIARSEALDDAGPQS